MDERALHALRIIADNDQVCFSGEDLRALLAAYDQAAARVAQIEDVARALLDQLDLYGSAYDGDAPVDALRGVVDGGAESSAGHVCGHCGHLRLREHNAGGCKACSCTSPYGGTT